MAKYDVTFSCGHTETVEMFGKIADRERKIEWYRDHCQCSECRKAKIDAANEKAAEDNKADGYAPLTGSEKQIAWAETIRREKIAELEQMPYGGTDAGRAAKVMTIDFVKSQITDAAEWIDNRNYSALSIVRNHQSELQEWAKR